MILLKEILFERINARGIEVRSLKNDEEKTQFSDYMLKHYLRNDAASVNIRYGIFYNNEMIGIIAYGPPSGPTIASKLGLGTGQLTELRRLYIRDDIQLHNAESQVISMGNQQVKEDNPNLKAVVTFADPAQGHTGIIYQATNSIYLGRGSGGSGKHKYLYLLGNTREKKDTMAMLNISQQPYPKSN